MGQIATLMDNLHLSYREVLEEIPYRNLMIMQRDKLHVATGEVVRHTTGKAMMKKKLNV